MRRGLSQTARHVITHGERGQTIVILAFGIIVLLAFVGIVTDVSLMFVRFSTLRRAVDAAAVSAAGQVRRLVPTTEEWLKAGGNLANAQSAAGVFNRLDPIEVDWVASGATADVANGLAFARNIANVKLAAESFIEFYGLDPIAVVVDTCATRPADTELCTEDQRKLIRVTAQISSPTVFLKLIGWPDITLESTSLSETAVLDVVLVMDVSESMLNETTYNDWERVPDEINTGSVINLGYRYIPPRMSSGDPNGNNAIVQVSKDIFADYNTAWQFVLNHTWSEISADPRFNAIEFYPPGRPGTPDASTRQECQIRFYPGSGILGNKDETFPIDLRDEYEARLAATWPKSWDGFIPTYNFYGCCNDPAIQNPDAFDNYDFTDLICQPFRQARDATEQFMQRIDF
ncbi:MAG: hypothetical protein K8I60_22005, partial [Anaerolineae bacterium]|nr:hypothetical protein [Anaerolineae bacterium]